MKIGVIISSNDAETCWNALRYANFCLGQKESVKVFLTGKGIEYQSISTGKFNTIEQAEKFLQGGGKVLACGTCIKFRNQEGTEILSKRNHKVEEELQFNPKSAFIKNSSSHDLLLDEEGLG